MAIINNAEQKKDLEALTFEQTAKIFSDLIPLGQVQSYANLLVNKLKDQQQNLIQISSIMRILDAIMRSEELENYDFLIG